MRGDISELLVYKEYSSIRNLDILHEGINKYTEWQTLAIVTHCSLLVQQAVYHVRIFLQYDVKHHVPRCIVVPKLYTILDWYQIILCTMGQS